MSLDFTDSQENGMAKGLDKKQLGVSIRAARKAKGLTQQQLADKLGLQGATIYKYEQGIIGKIPPVTALQLCRLLDLEPGLFCSDDTEGQRLVLAVIEDIDKQLSILADKLGADRAVYYELASGFLLVDKNCLLEDDYKSLKKYIKFLTMKE